MTPTMGKLGAWAHASKLSAALAQELEAAGYTTIWIGGSPGGDLEIVTTLLESTEQLMVATGIVNIWKDDPKAIAAVHRRIADAYPGRFVLGIGAGHPEATSDYRHPYEALVDYLDVLDGEGVPVDERVIAALGPKVLRLARDRAAGAHPYLVTPEHTRRAREILGPDALLVPEQKVVVGSDPGAARAIGRARVADPYLALSNYLNNLRRLGWADADFADDGSDALIDALAVHGSADEVAAQLHGHFEAGADQVAVQLLTADGVDPLDDYLALAAAVL